VPVYRSRFELERVLGRHGATDFAVVEADASASIQFAVHGCFVQLGLPLPDPKDARITATASGRPRSVAAQERAYEQALREHWRAFVLAVRGKLQSVESGISTFEDEFASFLVPHVREENGRTRRKKPRAVNWLLGSSHSLAIGLVAAFLVPTSAVSAFALPPSVVGHLSAPFRGVLPTEVGESSDDAHPLALGSSSWANGENGRDAAVAGDLGTLAEHHQVPSGSSGAAAEPGVDESEPPDGSKEASSGGAENSQNSGGAPHGGDAPGTHQGSENAPGAATPPPHGSVPSRGSDKPAGGGSQQPAPSDGAESSSGGQAPSDPGPAGPGSGNDEDGHDNGNHNGADNGNHNGADNGNHTGTDNGNHTGADNGNNTGTDNGNHTGADNSNNAGANGNHTGADNSNNAGADNGNHNGADNGNHSDNGNHYGADYGNHNGADNGKKAGDTGSGNPAAGKGQPQAGQ
jgi:hypothetical protein